MATINFNGRTYTSLEEMPAQERQAFEQLSAIFVDRNGNGIPDFLEGDLVQNVLSAFTSSVHFDGRTFSNLDELPPEVRGKVQEAFHKLSELGLVSGAPPAFSQPFESQVPREPMPVSRPFVSREYSPAIQEENPSRPMLWIAAIVGTLVCLAAAAFALLVFFQS